MEEFRIIYKMLNYMRKAMKVETPDYTPISAEGINIPEVMWLRLVRMMVDEGYIKGVKLTKDLSGAYSIAGQFEPEITLKGLEYLEENSLMRKAKDIAKGIVDIL